MDPSPARAGPSGLSPRFAQLLNRIAAKLAETSAAFMPVIWCLREEITGDAWYVAKCMERDQRFVVRRTGKRRPILAALASRVAEAMKGGMIEARPAGPGSTGLELANPKPTMIAPIGKPGRAKARRAWREGTERDRSSGVWELEDKSAEKRWLETAEAATTLKMLLRLLPMIDGPPLGLVHYDDTPDLQRKLRIVARHDRRFQLTRSTIRRIE